MSTTNAITPAPEAPPPIRTRRRPACWLCGSEGNLRFSDLRDHLFGAPGSWNLRQCNNDACRMVWLDPVPREEDIRHAYVTYYTHTSSTTPMTSSRRRIREAVRSGYLQGALGYTKGVGASWHRHLRFLAHMYPTGPGSIESETMFLPAPQFPARLLDLGCGNGDLLVRMRSLGWDVEAVELDPVAVQTARARGLEVRQGELHDQHYPSGSFDAVTMAHVIEHVYEPARLLREALRILKPGGILVMLTPNSQSLGAWMYGPDWRGWEPPRHLHIFNIDNLRVTLEQSGLTQVDVTSVAQGARDILTASQRLRRKRQAVGNVHEASPRGSRVIHTMLQIGERFLTVIGQRRGEELLATARKGAGS